MKKKLIFFIIFMCVSLVYSQSYYLNVNLKDGTKITYEIVDINKINFDNVTNIDDIKKLKNIVSSFKLMQNYPNPFNPSTTIQYEIPKNGIVEVSVYNINGSLVKRIINIQQQTGSHKVVWDGLDKSGNKVSSGFYLYIIRFNDLTLSKKMLLIK